MIQALALLNLLLSLEKSLTSVNHPFSSSTQALDRRALAQRVLDGSRQPGRLWQCNSCTKVKVRKRHSTVCEMCFFPCVFLEIGS